MEIKISKKEGFLNQLATAVLEKPEGSLTPESPLDPWDSLAVVGTIVVIDNVYGKQVNGAALFECQTVGDILKLVGEDD